MKFLVLVKLVSWNFCVLWKTDFMKIEPCESRPFMKAFMKVGCKMLRFFTSHLRFHISHQKATFESHDVLRSSLRRNGNEFRCWLSYGGRGSSSSPSSFYICGNKTFTNSYYGGTAFSAAKKFSCPHRWQRCSSAVSGTMPVSAQDSF